MKVPSLKDIDTSIRSINWYRGVAAAVFYGIVSGSMSFINKIVLTTFDYRYPEVIMLAQVTCTALGLEICRRSNLINISAYTLERAKKFLLPSICFALHTILALNALSDLSIPMYNILRRLLPLSTLILGVIVLSKSPSFQLTCSIILVVLGCIIAGLGDLSFHLGGYISAILSVFSQSIYLLYVQKTGVESGLSTLDVLHLNSVNCIPLLTIYTLYNNQLVNSFNSIKVTANGFFPLFIIDVLMGCVLNYSLFLCATMNSALTTSLVGVVKGIITTIIGFFTFGGVAVNLYTLSGIILNTSGGILYFYTKYSDQVRQKLQQEYMSDHVINVEAANGDVNKSSKTDNAVIDVEDNGGERT
ncbi:UDP-galactose UDP-glucose transporter 7 isoform X5 [Paramuricea clavata]|uniref:UDP-galactose UDP-glucose transporter 7 isoform X5 n=1 Tax=Paramuricea clavata TaxID=317549 RepID=A0A6S7FNI7_PARCT|nr:UDP-galactose UDP-glucose transporter 7 isoform X5 [Paramuricea clavata]